MRDASEVLIDLNLGDPRVYQSDVEIIEADRRAAKLEVLREMLLRLSSPHGGSYEEVANELITELESALGGEPDEKQGSVKP